jgi:hypothetical protein
MSNHENAVVLDKTITDLPHVEQQLCAHAEDERRRKNLSYTYRERLSIMVNLMRMEIMMKKMNRIK